MGIFNQFLRRTASVPRTEMRYTHFPTPWNEQCSSQRYPPPTLRRTASVPRIPLPPLRLIIAQIYSSFYKICLCLFAQKNSVCFIKFVCDYLRKRIVCVL
jgi:hypothetical protein